MRARSAEVARLAFVALAWLIAHGALSAQPLQGAASSPPKPLEAKRPQSSPLKTGETQVYSLHLTPGEFARVIIDQRGVDVVATLKNPRGESIAVFDSPNYVYGQEIVSLVAAEAGAHTIALSHLYGGKGSYQIELVELRPAKPDDDLRVAAERASYRIEEARSGSPENLKEGLRRADVAIELWNRIGDRMELAVTLIRRGSLHQTVNEHQAAVADFQRAEKILAEAGDSKPEQRHWRAIGLRNTGMSHSVGGDLSAAREHYLRSLEILESLGYPLERASTMTGLAWTLVLQGHYQEALEAATDAHDLAASHGDRYISGRAGNIAGLALWNLGDYDAAIRELNSALADARAMNDVLTEGYALVNLGMTCSLQGNDSEAASFYAAVLALQQKPELGLPTVFSLMYLGDTKVRGGKLDEADVLFTRARSLATDLGHRLGEILVLVSQSRGAEARGQSEETKRLLEDALARARALQNPESIAIVLAGLANLERKRGQLAPALSHIEEAVGIIEEISGSVSSIELRGSFFASRQSYYELWVEILMETHRRTGLKETLEKALVATERSRARALRELLDTARAEQIGADSFDMAAVRSTLDDSLLLEFALGDERSYLFVLDRDELRAYTLPGREVLEEKAKKLHELVTRPDRRAARRATALAAADTGKTLLGSAAAMFASRRLVMVPDGALHYVPFAMLVTDGTGRPLIAQSEIVVLPSAAVLPSLRARARASEKFVTVLADPVFSVDDARVGGSASGRVSRIPREALTRSIQNAGFGERLPRLPGTRREAEAILATSEGHGAFDFSASRETFFGPEVKRASILHVATHSVIDSRQPELSGLVFSLVDEKGKPSDGYIRLRDVFAAELQADLVVLSACRTALGKQVRGEGMIGLTRGLMHAGAKAVVATLWDVDDDATSALMKHFYGELSKGVPPGTALRTAQQKVREVPRWSAPWFWAGFVLHGDWR